MSEPASPSSPVSPTAPSMVSLARALNSTPVAATPRPASRAATVERPKVASPSRAVQRMGSKPPWHLVELLLVDGTRKRYDVGGEVSVGGVKRDVWEGWPEEFSSAGHGRPAGADGLRILFLGKFLPDSTTFGQLKLPAHETTIMHLIIKPESLQDGVGKLTKGNAGGNPCARCCIIA